MGLRRRAARRGDRQLVLTGAILGRVDRVLQEGASAFYVGGSFGYLAENDLEFYGGQGAAVGVQAGGLFWRDRRWGRLALEAQVLAPLFGPRPDKPGSTVFPIFTVGVHLFL